MNERTDERMNKWNKRLHVVAAAAASFKEYKTRARKRNKKKHIEKWNNKNMIAHKHISNKVLRLFSFIIQSFVAVAVVIVVVVVVVVIDTAVAIHFQWWTQSNPNVWNHSWNGFGTETAVQISSCIKQTPNHNSFFPPEISRYDSMRPNFFYHLLQLISIIL